MTKKNRKVAQTGTTKNQNKEIVRTNKCRADRAIGALNHYTEGTLCSCDELADLLADLMHLADAKKFSFKNCLRIAREHHSSEVNNEENRSQRIKKTANSPTLKFVHTL